MATVLEEQQGTVESQEAAAPEVAPEQPPAPSPSGLPRPPDEERFLTKEEIYRPALGALMTTLGCAFLVGGMFTGVVTPRLYAAIGGIAGVVAAVIAARARRRETLWQIGTLLGVLLVGLIMLGIGGGFRAVSNLGEVIGDATSNARLQRPPAPFEVGWRAILPWTVGMIGYAAAWVGVMGRKPAVGLLVPILPLAFAAIAQPPEAQVPAGIVAFATFVIGLAIIYRADRGEGQGVSTAYELRRAARTAPLMIVLVLALIFLSRTNLLFPDPLYDPTQQAQIPQVQPLSAVQDKVLFETQGDFTGPWRTGILSVYDGENWRLPPFGDSSFVDVPKNGIIDELFDNPVSPQVRAHVTVQGMEGVVLPIPARAKAIQTTNAPALVVDPLAQTIRVSIGQLQAGLSFDIVFALLPTEDTLRRATKVSDQGFLAEWTDVAGLVAPPGVAELIAKADAETDNDWDKLNVLRKTLLDTVTARGAGLPAPVPPSKVDDMLDGSQRGTPYEIVAGQVLMARWAGIPARIGYGFDRGKEIGATREFRPLHGSSWLEVYFQGSGWIPVTGLPKKADVTLGTSEQQLDVEILPSEEIQVSLFLPTRLPPESLLFKQIQKILLLASPFLVAAALIWLFWPLVYKARRTSRRRQWALQQGREARIAVAYAEFRDLATDLGVGDPYATPLAYTERMIRDDEHLELAWLVTRCLWGDLRDSVADDEVFAAEELSRSLRRRVFEAQPFTIRGIALVSRLSLRNPYAPELVSPPIQKVNVRRVMVGGIRRLNPVRLVRRKKKEIPREAITSA